MTKNTVVTITGPTCSGKSTLAQFLASRGVPEIRSFTTRDPRPGEVNKVHYDFIQRGDVQAIPQDQIIELVEFGGNLYGNTVGQLEEAWSKGRGVAAVVVEPNGVKHWNAAAIARGFNHFSIYLEQSPQTLVKRFSERLTKTAPHKVDSELGRMDNMLKVEHATWPKAFDYDLVVRNLGEGRDPYTDVTSEMILGFIALSFRR